MQTFLNGSRRFCIKLRGQNVASEQIVLRKAEPPRPADVEEDFGWVCYSLGICGRSRASENEDETIPAVRLFRVIVTESASSGNKGVTINRLSERLEISRTAVVHHLNRMESSGLVIRKGREYRLRRYGLERTIGEVRGDIEKMFDEFETIAKELDEEFGFKKREEPRRRKQG